MCGCVCTCILKAVRMMHLFHGVGSYQEGRENFFQKSDAMVSLTNRTSYKSVRFDSCIAVSNLKMIK